MLDKVIASFHHLYKHVCVVSVSIQNVIEVLPARGEKGECYRRMCMLWLFYFNQEWQS